MRRRFMSVIAAAAILVLLVGSVASAATVVSDVAGPDDVSVTELAPLGLAFTTALPTSAYVGLAFPVGLELTKTATFVPGAYTGAVIVAGVKEGADVVAEGDFTFGGSLVWTYDAALGWTAPVDANSLETGPPINIALTMTANGAGTFTVSFWIQTP